MAKKNPAKAKAAKQKKIAIGGGVILVVVMAIQAPTLMKKMSGKGGQATPAWLVASRAQAGGSTPVAGAPVSLAAPTLAGGIPAPVAVTGGSGLASELAPTASIGQLSSFGRFASKDPFASQAPAPAASGGAGGSTKPSIPTPKPAAGSGGNGGAGAASTGAGAASTGAGAASTGAGAASTGAGAASTGAGAAGTGAGAGGTGAGAGGTGAGGTGSGGTGSGGTGSGGTTILPAPPSPAPTSAVISVNGIQASVAVGTDFPAAAPLFHLLSLTQHAAKVAIAGGSYANGAPSILLKDGKRVTLQNTADGTRYTIELFKQGTVVPVAAAAPAVPAGTSTTSGG